MEVCTPEVIGSIINFSSDYGNYRATISELKENEEMTIKYDKGIMQGDQVWQLKELEPMLDEFGNLVPKTQVCYDANVIPTTKKLQLFTSFLSDASKRSYFSPLLDALDGRMAQQAAEDRRIKEELVLQQQIQEQEKTILVEEDQQIEELKSIQLQLSQIQTQIQQYMLKLEAQKSQREKQRSFQTQQPVLVGTSTPPPLQPPVTTPTPLPTPNVVPPSFEEPSIPEPIEVPPPSLPAVEPDSIPTLALPITPPAPVSLPEPEPVPEPEPIPEPITVITEPELSDNSSNNSNGPSDPLPSPSLAAPSRDKGGLLSLFGMAKAEHSNEQSQDFPPRSTNSLPPALVSVLNPPPIVVAVAQSTKSSMDEPFSQVALQDPHSIEKVRNIEIMSIDEPIIVVQVNKPQTDS